MGEQFSVHSAPVWRERANFIVNAVLPEEGRYEQLWSRQVSEDTFEVCCIPFFLYDIALGDLVQTSPRAGRKYVLSRVLTQSGRYVFRVHFDPAMLRNRDATVAALNEMGALLEWSSSSLLAVDAQDHVHAEVIAGYLFECEQLRKLVYETGNS